MGGGRCSVGQCVCVCVFLMNTPLHACCAKAVYIWEFVEWNGMIQFCLLFLGNYPEEFSYFVSVWWLQVLVWFCIPQRICVTSFSGCIFQEIYIILFQTNDARSIRKVPRYTPRLTRSCSRMGGSKASGALPQQIVHCHNFAWRCQLYAQLAQRYIYSLLLFSDAYTSYEYIATTSVDVFQTRQRIPTTCIPQKRWSLFQGKISLIPAEQSKKNHVMVSGSCWVVEGADVTKQKVCSVLICERYITQTLLWNKSGIKTNILRCERKHFCLASQDVRVCISSVSTKRICVKGLVNAVCPNI